MCHAQVSIFFSFPSCVATLASSLNRLGHFSILARVTSANPSHSAMLMVSSPKPRTPKFVGGGPTLLPLHSGLTAQSVTIGVRWTSNLKLIIALPEQHYNYPSHTRQLCLHLGPMPMEALPFGLGWVRPHHLTHIRGGLHYGP
jgi:hypothetical protein